MNSYTKYDQHVIKACYLFQGIPENELSNALNALNAYKRAVRKGEIIIHYGEPIRYAYLILDGQVEGAFDTESYHKIRMNVFHAGQLFGESLAIMQLEESPVEALAIRDTSLLVLDINHLFMRTPCCSCEMIILQNLMRTIASQNHFLTTKVRILSQKSLRDRIMVYLMSSPSHDHQVTLPFSKSAWASYLGVNRTAMERELSRMIDDGLIIMDGKTIILKGEV